MNVNDSIGMDPYASDAPPLKTSGMAIASLILGIIALLTSCILIGGLFAIIGLILGILAITQTGAEGPMKGRGYAITGTVLNGAAVVLLPVMFLLAGILLPALGRAREIANRAVCGANLRGIHQAA